MKNLLLIIWLLSSLTSTTLAQSTTFGATAEPVEGQEEVYIIKLNEVIGNVHTRHLATGMGKFIPQTQQIQWLEYQDAEGDIQQWYNTSREAAIEITNAIIRRRVFLTNPVMQQDTTIAPADSLE
ncbi:MAG: hypothetical protein WD077_09080 [Bacteroidia bacterium]